MLYIHKEGLQKDKQQAWYTCILADVVIDTQYYSKKCSFHATLGSVIY